MTLHYHGLPLTPAEDFEHMRGRNFCISFATCRGRPTMVRRAFEIGQSLMGDNGAFTFWRQRQGTWLERDRRPLYDWLEPFLGHPHWAVVPDVIGGSVDDQRVLVREWPFARDYGAPVWHLGAPLDYLLELVDEWPRVCLGSSGDYAKVGDVAWSRRMDEIFDFLQRHRPGTPLWLHGLRMLAQIGKRWPLASADSVNVARNFSRNEARPCCMATRIDAVNGPVRWPGLEDLLR